MCPQKSNDGYQLLSKINSRTYFLATVLTPGTKLSLSKMNLKKTYIGCSQHENWLKINVTLQVEFLGTSLAVIETLLIPRLPNISDDGRSTPSISVLVTAATQNSCRQQGQRDSSFFASHGTIQSWWNACWQSSFGDHVTVSPFS